MHGAQFKLTRLFVAALLTVLFALHPHLAAADEAADIARILELNDAYAAASRAWRAKEITRSEMQAAHKAIQAESRKINSSYGPTGSAERRAWDQKLLQAKNAYTKQKRRDAQAAKAEAAAADRAAADAKRVAAEAAAAEQRTIAERAAAEQVAAERAKALKSPLVSVELITDFEPANQLERDALALAPIRAETKALRAERGQVNPSISIVANEARQSLINDRLDILSAKEETVASRYEDDDEAHDQLYLLAGVLGGDLANITPDQVDFMPVELQALVTENVAQEEAQAEAARNYERRRQIEEWLSLFSGARNGELALWIAILLGIAMSFGAPRGIARLSKDGNTLTLAGWKYSLSKVSGVLLDSQQHTTETTLIEASGGVGSMIDGTGYITPRQEAVKDITTFDNVFVRDDNGVEHNFELEDFPIKARTGNRVTILLANGARADERPILFYNDDTRKWFSSTRVMRELLKPSFLWALVNAVLIYFIASELAIPLLDDGEVFGSVLVTSFCLWWIGGNRLTVAAVRTGLFNSGKTKKQLIRQVAGEQATGGAVPVA